MEYDIFSLLKKLVAKDGSDLHLKAGSPPIMRVHGELHRLEEGIISEEDMNKITGDLINQAQRNQLTRDLEIDFAFRVPGMGRFRTNVFIQRGSIAVSMRRVKTEVHNFADLNLPPVLNEIAKAERGIVLICGSTNSGKSTTLAAFINRINETQRKHIITIEDPIEYLYHDKRAIICQREIGVDTWSFKNALRAVTREDPDVIVIGEMRDADSFMAAISASETGHLVFCTLHSTGASKAVSRILEFFPHAMHEVVRFQLAANLHSVIAQKLLLRKDKSGVVPALEILIATGLIKKLIRENQMDRMTQAVESGAEFGMQTFTQALVKMVKDQTISEETAFQHAPNPEVLRMNLKGIYLDESRRILDRNLD